MTKTAGHTLIAVIVLLPHWKQGEVRIRRDPSIEHDSDLETDSNLTKIPGKIKRTE